MNGTGFVLNTVTGQSRPVQSKKNCSCLLNKNDHSMTGPVANPIKNLPVKFTRIQLFFYKFSKSNPIKPFLPVNFSGGFYKWIFHWKIHWKKFESYKKICLLVKFTVKKINPIKPRILQGKNLLVNFKIDFHKMKYYNQSYNYIAILIYIKGFNFRNRWNRY